MTDFHSEHRTSEQQYYRSDLRGQGLQNTGTGSIQVSGDVNINSDPDYDQNAHCLRDLKTTDPRDDKRRIESKKGGLLADLYVWVRDNPEFKQWRDGTDSRLLWIKGDPGKGKTMLICGLINDLRDMKTSIDNLGNPNTEANAKNLIYFFCEATDPRINSATAVIRGLMFMLVEQQSKLLPHLRKKYDNTGDKLFQDANAWTALSTILIDMLQDPGLNFTYLVVDALDECRTDLSSLLDFIVLTSSKSLRVKWIVSSRNWPTIQKYLDKAMGKVKLCLELNEESISMAVEKFIEIKVDDLAEQNEYDEACKEEVQDYLSSNAENTFLWVALVCEELRNIDPWDVQEKLKNFPPKLDELYAWMMNQIHNSNYAERCRGILATVAVARRPIVLKELLFFIDIKGIRPNNYNGLRTIIRQCGSFLNSPDVEGGAHGGETISFVHQSAKDYVMKNAATIFPDNENAIHQQIVLRSIDTMHKVLRRDIYNLQHPGRSIDEIEAPHPDPLDPVRYACTYWLDHLCAIESGWDEEILRDGGKVDGFLRKHFLHWLEASSLIKDEFDIVIKLGGLLWKLSLGSVLFQLSSDAHRFILSHQYTIKSTPLQVYSSALLFSPTNSLIRTIFRSEEPEWVTGKQVMGTGWGAYVQTFGYFTDKKSEFDTSVVAFSNDSTRIAALSRGTIKVWDLNRGACIQTLEYRKNYGFETNDTRVKCIAFSNNNHDLRILTELDDKTFQIRNFTNSGARSHMHDTMRVPGETSGCFQIPFSYGERTRVTFSHDGTQLALWRDGTVRIWGVDDLLVGISSRGIEMRYQHTRYPERFSPHVIVVFSKDNNRIAVSMEHRIIIWDTTDGICEKVLPLYNNVNSIPSIASIAFSTDNKQLAFALGGKFEIWDIGTIHSTYKLRKVITRSREFIDPHWNSALAFSNDGSRIALGSRHDIQVWDIESGAHLQTLSGHDGSIRLIRFSDDGRWMVSISLGPVAEIKIWDNNNIYTPVVDPVDSHDYRVCGIVISVDGVRIASTSADGIVKLWDSSGACTQTLNAQCLRRYGEANVAAFSNDGKRIATNTDNKINVWDIDDRGICGKAPVELSRGPFRIKSIAFSHNDKLIASSTGNRIDIWNASGSHIKTMIYKSAIAKKIWMPERTAIAFSNNSKLIALASDNGRRDGFMEFNILNTKSIPDTSVDEYRGCFPEVTGVTITIQDDGSLKVPTLEKIMVDNADLKVRVLGAGGVVVLQITDADLYQVYFASDSDSEFGSDVMISMDMLEVQHDGYGISADRAWVTWNGQNVLRLPLEYQPEHFDIVNNTLAIGCSSGRVLIFTFSSESPLK
ncbi:hypothetical protein TWF730_010862 [Orbilia blumenaviensis]|uniref:NACHT domain-containing protein n=1 Tax=Orbilia blumenaviensis TaxID=1796055 RepID=A0AAV9UPZ3_9PEZI